MSEETNVKTPSVKFVAGVIVLWLALAVPLGILISEVLQYGQPA